MELGLNGCVAHIVQDGGHKERYRLDGYVSEQESQGADCSVDIEDGHADVLKSNLFV